VTVRDDEAFDAHTVDNQAILIPETIDAIRALTGREKDAQVSIARTNAAWGMSDGLVGKACKRIDDGYTTAA
jgi:glyceraldehyde-3-phosphate dehydrogenase (NAD(P))